MSAKEATKKRDWLRPWKPRGRARRGRARSALRAAAFLLEAGGTASYSYLTAGTPPQGHTAPQNLRNTPRMSTCLIVSLTSQRFKKQRALRLRSTHSSGVEGGDTGQEAHSALVPGSQHRLLSPLEFPG